MITAVTADVINNLTPDAGVVLFKEKLSRREWIGIGMILTALVFLNI